jgi:hypothetical protein
MRGTVKRSHPKTPSVTFQETTWGEGFELDICGATVVNLSDANQDRSNAYPKLTPYPLSISTRMSNSNSCVSGSHETAHQFRRPIIYLFWTRLLPFGSFVKTGSYKSYCINSLQIMSTIQDIPWLHQFLHDAAFCES